VDLLILIVLGFVVMWLVVVLPQRRRQSALTSMLGALAPGDQVVTAGGMYGTVTDVDDEDVLLEVAPEVEVRVAKRAIAALVPAEERYEEEELEENAVNAENESVGESRS